jgi:hypothetical protein
MPTDEDRDWVETWAAREDQYGGFPGFSGGARRSQSSKGEVVEYDVARAMATIQLDSGQNAQLHALAFFSGRPSRLPTVGEKIVGHVVNVLGTPTMVAARPQTETEAAGPLIDRGLLNDAALQLLASSTAERYARQAVLYSRKSKLARSTPQELLARLQAAWVVLRQPNRDSRPVEEIEAALILAALWDQSKEFPLPMEFHWAVDFKESADYPGTEWLVALTRRLLQEG